MQLQLVVLEADVDEPDRVFSDLADGERVPCLLEMALRLERERAEVLGPLCPEGLDVPPDLVVFVGELDVVGFNIVPPEERVCERKG